MWHDDSSFSTAAFTQFLLRFFGEPCESPSLDIGFELTVPVFAVEIRIPSTKRRQFRFGKSANRIFYLLDRCHASRLYNVTEYGNLASKTSVSE